MTKKQRVINEVKRIKRDNVLGAGRTAELNTLRKKYLLAENVLKKWCTGVAGADYWV